MPSLTVFSCYLSLGGLLFPEEQQKNRSGGEGKMVWKRLGGVEEGEATVRMP